MTEGLVDTVREVREEDSLGRHPVPRPTPDDPPPQVKESWGSLFLCTCYTSPLILGVPSRPVAPTTPTTKYPQSRHCVSPRFVPSDGGCWCPSATVPPAGDTDAQGVRRRARPQKERSGAAVGGPERAGRTPRPDRHSNLPYVPVAPVPSPRSQVQESRTTLRCSVVRRLGGHGP